jgi:4-carboxymuconolactone decarboxylase
MTRVQHIADRASIIGSDEWLTDTVYLDARTARHTHPLGQVFFATHGQGRVSLDGESVRAQHAGDVIAIPPGRRDCHGAAPAASRSRQ